MPINTDLNTAPYFDDFDLENQYYRVMFKPSYAVQARELTQLQSVLQNQIEQFGDNVFKEGSIVKGCNFTQLADLQYVKLTDKTNFDPTVYVGFADTEVIGGIEYPRDNTYKIVGDVSGVEAEIVAATRGFETRDPDLNTFYINYTTTSSGNKTFQAGELLYIDKVSSVDVGTSTIVTSTQVETINVTNFANPVGNSFGLRSAPGIIFQKGHFLYTEEQLVVVSKYTNQPDNVSLGFVVQERLITALQDNSLYDNANGSTNENAPGADRLKLTPVLTVLPTPDANADVTFFTLRRYVNGCPVALRDVSKENNISEALARRTFEESGDYVVNNFDTKVIRRGGNLQAAVSTGLAYVKGYRVENLEERLITIDPIANTSVVSRLDQQVSLDYGGYIDIIDTGTGSPVPIGDYSTVTIKDGSSTNIGTARVLNVTNNKIFLVDIRQANTAAPFEARTIHGPSGSITIANTSIDTWTVNDPNKAPMIFDTGALSVKSTENITIPVRENRFVSGISNNTITLSPGVGEDFAFVNNDDIYFVDSTDTQFDVVSTTLVGSDLVVELSGTPASTANIYFNKRIVDAQPYTKASAELYVKCTANTSVDPNNAKLNLGFPDVYEIISITDSANNDVTSSFRLYTNQKEYYYDHSYIQYIPGRKIPVDGDMTVRMKAFKLNDTTGEYFFTADSYPVGVDKNKIPPYKSFSGKIYNLSDCIDFRPHVEPIAGANYTNAASEGTAPVVSNYLTSVNIAPSFDAGNEILTPALNQNIELDYDSYLNRTDSITVDPYGKIRRIRGNPSENSVPPNITGDQLRIADIYIPGSPALTQEEAYEQDRIQYGVKVTQTATKSYKMSDIEKVEKKIDNLRYHVLLTSLEAETKNLNILDSTGIARFKNGIIVDPFNDLRTANIEDPEFTAALDFTEKSLIPAVKTFPLNLKYKTNSSSSIFPSTSNAKVATLARNVDVSIINQPYATTTRNCVSNFYTYRGKGALDPEYDPLYDVTKNPVYSPTESLNPIEGYFSSIHELIPQTSTSSDVLARWIKDRNAKSRSTFASTDAEIQASGESTNEVPVGDFVTNGSFKSYIRPREIKIYMTGLRPNTRHYFFFDQVDVNSSVAPGSDVDSAYNVARYGDFGDAVESDSNGKITAVFAIPADTFLVGNRKLEVADVSTYGSISSSSTSYGSLVYGVYNFTLKKSSFTSSTRASRAALISATSERNVSGRIFEVDGVCDNNGFDPIAQTFFVKSGMGLDSNTVFLSKIDLYFKRKSSVNGVTVEIREVLNGYPSYQSVPFSSVHLTPSEVNVSDDASVATTFTFTAPIRLDVEKEYAVVIEPDAADPNYLVFTSQVGGANIVPGANKGLVVAQDWGDGALFTSANNKARKPSQDEDLKFTLYRHNFNASSGSVTLTNDDHEFLTITGTSGTFQTGEIVYTIHNSDAATSNTVSTSTGNNQITGTGMSTTYAGGDYLIVDDSSTNKQIFRVVSANSTVVVTDRPAAFTVTATANPITVGTLVHNDFRYPDFIILEKSSATATRKFVTSDTIYGFDSDATSTISTVDDIELSYVQPMIARTNDNFTATELSGTFVDPAVTTNTYAIDIPFNDKTAFNEKGTVIFSKSNDIAREKTMDFVVTMTNGSNVTSSPFVDIETSSVLAYQWKVTNSASTTSRYVSKTVTLPDNVNAEDFELRLTGYRPTGTEIVVYIRPQASYDPSVFSENDWIQLSVTDNTNLYSSGSNLYDFKELIYKVPNSAKDVNGVLTYQNEIGTYEGYRRFAVRISLKSDSVFYAPRVLDYRGIALT